MTRLLLILLMFTSKSEAIEISGKITAFNSLPLNNVSVTCRKSKAEAKSNGTGDFIIEVQKGDIITFSAEGFHSFKIKAIGSNTDRKINLVFIDKKKYRSLAVENNHLTKDQLLYNLENSSAENTDNVNFTNIFDLISYKFPAVRVSLSASGDGEKSIIIPGSSYNSFSLDTSPLFVVDGVIVNSISYITPRDVDRISILKHGEASVYGSRASNGVVVIYTKTGDN